VTDEPVPPHAQPDEPADVAALEAIGDDAAVFESLWRKALDAWDDDKPHRAVLEHALKAEKLPDLAGRYRALRDDPVRGERAQKKIDGIVTAAMQLMMATKTPQRTKTPWQWTAAATMTFAIIAAWLMYKLFFPHR
jgi:hypothetical protein